MSYISHPGRRSRAGRVGCIIAAAAAMFATVISAVPAAQAAPEGENIVPGTYTDTASPPSISVGVQTTETFTLTNTSTKQASIASARLTLGGLPATDAAIGSNPVNKSGWSASKSSTGNAVITLNSSSQADGDNDSDDSSAVAPGKSVSVTVSITAPSAGYIPVTSVVEGSGTFSPSSNDIWSLSTGSTDPSIQVLLRTQTISFTAPSSATAGGTQYTPTATASSGLPVSFTLDSTSSGCSLSGGMITFNTSGTCVIDANQSGNNVYAAAPQVQQSITINLATQTINFTAPTSVTAGGQYTPTATASSGLPVSFTLDSTSSGCSLSGGMITFNTSGTCVIDANQAGNNAYAAAPQVQRQINVALVTQTISFTAPSSATAGGTQYTPTATASSGLPVGFSLDSTSSGCSLSGGVITFNTSGTCVIDANQAGNNVYAAAPQVQQSVTINLANQTISFTVPATGIVGSSPTPTVSATSGLAVTLTVDSSSTTGACSVSGATSISLTGAGTCVLDANQAGNNVYAAAPQVQQDITVSTAKLFFSQDPTSIQSSSSTNNYMCPPVTVQLETSTNTFINAGGVSITITLFIPATNPATPDPLLSFNGTSVEPGSGVTGSTNGSGAAVFGTGTIATGCTSGFIATATTLGEGYALNASGAGNNQLSGTFAVVQTVTPCPSSCTSPTNTSASGTTGSVTASTSGTFNLATSFGENDQLNCSLAVSSYPHPDPYLVTGSGSTTGNSVTKTVTMVFPKVVVQGQPQNEGTPHMQVCAGANVAFPTPSPYPGSTSDPFQGLLYNCGDSGFKSSTLDLKMCIQSESKNGANVETVVLSITSPPNDDPHTW
jgi:hypothetical protein